MSRPKGDRRKRLPAPPAPRRRSTDHIDVTRAEFNRLIRTVRDRSEIIETMRRGLDVQFQRIAQIQGDLDHIKRMLERLQLS